MALRVDKSMKRVALLLQVIAQVSTDILIELKAANGAFLSLFSSSTATKEIALLEAVLA